MHPKIDSFLRYNDGNRTLLNNQTSSNLSTGEDENSDVVSENEEYFDAEAAN